MSIIDRDQAERCLKVCEQSMTLWRETHPGEQPDWDYVRLEHDVLSMQTIIALWDRIDSLKGDA